VRSALGQGKERKRKQNKEERREVQVDQDCFERALVVSSHGFGSFGDEEDDDEDEEEARVDGEDLEAKEGRELCVKDPALGGLLIEGGLKGLVAEKDVGEERDGDGDGDGDGEVQEGSCETKEKGSNRWSPMAARSRLSTSGFRTSNRRAVVIFFLLPRL